MTVDVAYNVREGWLRVEDNGRGMSRPELSKALVLALSGKGAADIGKFGLGMKTACSSLGDRFVVSSACSGATYAHSAEYDEELFLTAGEWKLPIQRRKKTRPHGTTITIQSSRLYASLHQSLTRNLSWTFRHFLLDGILELTVNGLAVEPASYEVDPTSVMPFEGVVAGKSVRGWAGLLVQSSQRGWYGFALVRHRRIVRRHEKLGFQAHPQTARVVGEIHLDDFDTNNLKTDFIRETAAWRELEEWVSKQVEPVIAASRALAHAGMLDLKIRSRIEDERSRLLGDLSVEGLNLPNGPGQAGSGSESRAIAVAVGSLHLEHVFVHEGDAPYASTELLSRSGEADLLMVRTNLDHVASRQIADRSGWACHNIAEAAAAKLASTEEFVAMKSIVLDKLLAERPLRRALTEAAREFTREPEPATFVTAEAG